MRPRLAAEVALLRECYLGLEHAELGGEDWFRIPAYRVPGEVAINGALVDTIPVVFKVNAAYPHQGGEPYGFAVPQGLTIRGSEPTNAGATFAPPFGGTWRVFSWAPDGWVPTDDPRIGSNLLSFVRSFSVRVKEGP